MEPRRGPIAVAAGAVGFALLTAFVFLARAGDPSGSNWPVNWELRSSDNGVLFQLMQDLFAGRTLDWSFSPQVYVFPEIPISFLAYIGAAGNVYVYYLLVAVIDNTLLFLAILGVLRLLFPDERMAALLARASLAAAPLLIFPLVGTAWILSFPLAPTYYYGMYLVLLGAPALVLTRGWVRGAVAVGIALTAASNPLLLVFAMPAFGIVLVLLAVRRGMRAALRAAVPAVLALILAFVVRVLLFAPLQGTSPLSYVDPAVFATRVSQLGPYFGALSFDTSTRVILGVGATLAVVCLIGAVVVSIGYLRGSFGERMLAFVYFGLVPLLGIAATAALLITHYLYFWPVLIAPFVFVLMTFPGGWALRALPAVAAGLVVVAVVTGAPAALTNLDRYFGYRNDETRCLDEGLPVGVTVGYATFSDARRLSLTSQLPFRLIQLRSDGSPAYWLTNRDYLHGQPGQFFYLNGRGDELAIDSEFITSRFGTPDEQFSCGDDQTVLVYTDSAKLAAIADHYGAGR